MTDGGLENQQNAMMRIITNIASIEPLFPVMWDPLGNLPQATWPDRLGLVDRPESAWERIQQPHIPSHLRLLVTPDHLANMFNGQVWVVDPNQAHGSQQNFHNAASGDSSIQSLFPYLWDRTDDVARDAADPRRPVSPSNVIEQEPLEVRQRELLGPIGEPPYADENEDDWSDVGSEFDDYWDSDYYYDSGFDSGSETDGESSMDERDPNAGLERRVYEYYCPSCDQVFFLHH